MVIGTAENILVAPAPVVSVSLVLAPKRVVDRHGEFRHRILEPRARRGSGPDVRSKEQAGSGSAVGRD